MHNRGVQGTFIACVDGLKGFPDAIEAAFPQTTVQLCIVHLHNISKRWTLPIRDWKTALNRFTFEFEGRVPQL